jgi:trigger factor
MASVSQENIGKYHEKVIVHLTKEDYLPVFEKALKQYSKNANIPGFRKGMVPVGMVKKMYGASLYRDEVLKVAGAKLEEHLIANKTEIFARPIPAATQKQYSFDMNNPEDFSFEFEMGTKPEYTLPLLSGSTTVPLYKVNVTDEMVNEEIEKLQYKAGDMSDPETVTSEDNVLNVVFEEVDLNGVVIEGGIKKDNSLLVKYFSPSLQSQLMGKKANDVITFSLKDNFDATLLPAIMKDLNLSPTDEEAKNKSFNMLIVKVGLVIKSEINAAMFEKIYPGRNLETVEQFKEVLKGEIEMYWNQQARTKLHNDLFERLVHETPIELPETFLKRWMSIGGEQYKSPEQVEKEYGTFDHQMRWQLISDKIVEDNKLGVTNEEMDQAARAQIMSYFGQYGGMNSMDLEADWVEPFVKKQLEDKKFTDELYNRIITDKLFYTIEQSINLQETVVSVDEFAKLPSAHHHHH